jgi:hypothetical protein
MASWLVGWSDSIPHRKVDFTHQGNWLSWDSDYLPGHPSHFTAGYVADDPAPSWIGETECRGTVCAPNSIRHFVRESMQTRLIEETLNGTYSMSWLKDVSGHIVSKAQTFDSVTERVEFIYERDQLASIRRENKQPIEFSYAGSCSPFLLAPEVPNLAELNPYSFCIPLSTSAHLCPVLGRGLWQVKPGQRPVAYMFQPPSY